MPERTWWEWKIGDLVELKDNVPDYYRQYKNDIGIITEIRGTTFYIFWQQVMKNDFVADFRMLRESTLD